MVALGCIPAHALFFSIYEVSHSYLNVTQNELNPHLAACVGIFATIGHDLVNTPADVIKQRMQLLENNSKFFNVARDIMKTEGLIALFRSLPITLVSH